RLREEIDRQLKAQQAGEADTGDTAEDDENWEDEEEDTAAEEDTDIPTANCSTLASAVKSIVEIAADGKPEDKSLKAKLGQKLNSLIRGASAGFNQLPNKMECSLGGGTAVKNIDDDVKKEFDKQFRTDCKRLAREARAAVKAGDLKAYADYMEGQISELSQTSINDAVVKKCNSGDTVVADTQPGGTSGVGGTGSGGSGGGGQQNYDQSYPQNYEPPGHQHSLSGSPGGANERPFQSSLPPIPESHNDDPPGMTFPPGARRLKMRFDGRQYGQDDRYANCVFHDGTSPVLDCKKKLDWVLRDVLGRN
ncbi:MAG TPA: hypothetical protein PLO23_04300, partial [Alphaproteobacteria bacterium]|nr:hypothetical protein [Alphaproteobacteria bacterium]